LTEDTYYSVVKDQIGLLISALRLNDSQSFSRDPRRSLAAFQSDGGADRD
jgi:hypothetical protein